MINGCHDSSNVKLPNILAKKLKNFNTHGKGVGGSSKQIACLYRYLVYAVSTEQTLMVLLFVSSIQRSIKADGLLFVRSKHLQETEFVQNMVRTAKYEFYNFLPKFLWEEFNPATKIANVYFLFIAALQASAAFK